MEKIFDSHSHYNDKAYTQDVAEVLQRIQDSGVCHIINCGYNLVSSEKALAQAKRYSFISCSAGYHPQNSDEMTEGAFSELATLLKEEKVVSLGEIGLDYYYENAPDKEIQKQVFIKQLDLALNLDMPIIVHTRDAMQDTLEILSPYAHKLSGVIHCYSGSAESCVELVRMGFYIGFTGVVTFKNARRALEALHTVPLDRLLVETDCPYMAPEPYRGKRCDSSMLHFTVEKIAAELGLSKDEVAKATRENAERLFKLSSTCL